MSNDVVIERGESNADQRNEDSVLHSKLVKQMQFYFNDSNLPRDKFLLEKIRSNPDGWVSVELIASFGRMKALTADLKLVQEAIRASEPLLELNSDGTMVRRRLPLDSSRDNTACTVYMKGFPVETTLEDLESFLHPLFPGAILSIMMRRIKEEPRHFKGSIFIDFTTPEAASKAVLDHSNGLSFTKNDDSTPIPLSVMSKKDYLSKKNNKSDGNQPVSFVPGCLLQASFDSSSSISIDIRAFKASFEQATGVNVAFVENPTTLDTGKKSFIIRLHQPSASSIIEKLQSKFLLTVDDVQQELELSIPTEPEEQKYYNEYMQARRNVLMKKRRAPYSRNQGNNSRSKKNSSN
jgi:lupus La protein